MNILFYVPPFRDRDFWPIARSALTAGHDVYYAITNSASSNAVLEADRRLGFELVFSEDRAARTPYGTWLNMRLSRQPALIEVVVNDLAEIVMELGDADGSFSGLARNRVCVGVMDRDLLQRAQAIGVPQVAWLPYEGPPIQVTDPAYYARRDGERLFGEIHADDLSPGPKTRGSTPDLKTRGSIGSERLTDVVFLGECKPGPNLPLLRYIAARCLPSTSMDALLSADVHIRKQIAIDAEPYAVRPNAIADAVQQHAPPFPEDRSAQIGFALVKEHYEEQVRVMRRLAYVRRLATDLGSRFELYGDDFMALGLPARPTDHEANEQKYLRSKMAVDFGCSAYECSLDHRPSRILECGLLLLQFGRGDSQAWYGDLNQRMTFRSADELIAKVNHFLESPKAAASMLRAEQDLAATPCGMDAIVREFLEAQAWNGASS